MQLFHGTSADAAKQILKEGFLTECGGAIWTPSGEAVYFWSKEKLIEAGEMSEDSDDYAFARRAAESGEMALARAKDCRVVVFEVELEAHEIEDDLSCPNMDGAVCCNDSVPASAIKGAWITDDLSLLRGYFLAMHYKRDLVTMQMTELEEKIARLFQNAEIYPDDIDDIANFRRVTLEELRALLQISI